MEDSKEKRRITNEILGVKGLRRVHLSVLFNSSTFDSQK